MFERLRHAVAAVVMIAAVPVAAERAEYGQVYLNGLARDQGQYDDAPTKLAMVCNVNGPDGYLSIRTGPGSDFKAARNLKRLAIVVIDRSERRGNWVRIVDAYREASPQGYDVPYKKLTVQGWAHDGYLCDFIH